MTTKQFPLVRAILFDLDGTLLDTHDLLLATFRYTARTVLREAIPDERLMAKVGQPLTLRRHARHDHGYHFIQSFIDDHLHHHAAALG